MSGLVDGDGNKVSAGVLEGREVILFSGIARPESFEASITGMGIEPEVSIRFEDHHDYSQADVGLVKNASGGIPVFITTEKDIHKAKGFFTDDLLLALRVEAMIPGIEILLEG